MTNTLLSEAVDSLGVVRATIARAAELGASGSLTGAQRVSLFEDLAHQGDVLADVITCLQEALSGLPGDR